MYWCDVRMVIFSQIGPAVTTVSTILCLYSEKFCEIYLLLRGNNNQILCISCSSFVIFLHLIYQ